MEKSVETLIIGAGPAGLAVAGRMRHAGLDFEIVEKTDQIASSWHGHYDRLLLHTIKQFSHLPHMPFPDDYPIYVPRNALIDYYQKYARKFEIRPHFNCPVSLIEKEGKQWTIRCQNSTVFRSNRVVIATGVNHVPNRPRWDGEQDYRGQISHSRTYKNPAPYMDKKVLIVGMGNTGAEIALDLAEHGVPVTVSVRSPVSIVPRDVFGRPVQITAKRLEKLPFGIGDWVGTQFRKIVIGDLSKYGVPMAKVHPAVQLKETGKTPVIDLGTVKYIRSGKIRVVGDIERFTSKGVQLSSGKELQFDAVILATGYKANLTNLIEGIDPELDRFGVPKGPIAETDKFSGLYFVGFDNYKLGGILGTIYDDSKQVVEDIVLQSGS